MYKMQFQYPFYMVKWCAGGVPSTEEHTHSMIQRSA